MQMGEVPISKGGSIISLQRKKNVITGPMNAEEIRINKKLLREIGKRKREKGLAANGSTSSIHS
jgi:hypothetical protein